MKKWIIVISVAVLSVALIIMVVTGGFTKNILTGKIYRPQNVYEEIWNLLLIEEHTTNKTVLTSSTKTAEEDWDFGIDFVGIHIPECNVTISWERSNRRELSFLLSLGKGEYVHFIYNYETKTLFGDTEHSYLMENFLTDYFAWCEAASDFSSDFSAESLGEFVFRYENPIYNRELSN